VDGEARSLKSCGIHGGVGVSLRSLGGLFYGGIRNVDAGCTGNKRRSRVFSVRVVAHKRG
jgi:hypothetical protein